MNYWHNYPFVRILIPFIIGIIVAISFEVFVPIWVFVIILLCCFALTYFAKIRTYKLRNLYGVFMFLLFVMLGITISWTKLQKPKIPLKQNIQAVIASIIEPPDETEKTIKLAVKTEIFVAFDTCTKQLVKALLYLQKDSLSKKLLYGDKIIITSGLDTIQAPVNPYAFNFKRYLKYKQIYFQTYIRSDQWQLISTENSKGVKFLANKIRVYLIELLKENKFESEYLGVASAILLGYDQILDPETRDEFANAGAMHVLCVSGLHVGIIYLIFASLFSFLKRYKKGDLLKGILLLLVIWLYAFITGLSPSVLRASCMLSFIIIGESMNRKASVYNSLAASAFLLLLINPLMLMEVGFQLSYTAVLGIVSIYPILRKRFYVRNKILQKIRDILIVSLAAQLGTFPLAIYYFHQFPLYFLLTNLLVVSFAGIIIYVGFIFFALSAVPYLNLVLAFVLKQCIRFMNLYVEFIESLPYSSIEGLVFSIPAILLLFLLMVAVFRSILFRNKIWFNAALVSVLLLLMLFSFRNYTIQNAKKFVVYNAGYGMAIDFLSSGENLLLVDSLCYSDQKKIAFIAKNHWVYSGVKKPQIKLNNFSDTILNNWFLKYKSVVYFFDKKILILDGKVKNVPLIDEAKFDYVVLISNPRLSLRELDSLYHPSQIIINANNYASLRKQWEAEAKELDIPTWFVAKEGAFVKDLD